jgi:hypothetical protein
MTASSSYMGTTIERFVRFWSTVRERYRTLEHSARAVAARRHSHALPPSAFCATLV